ncbi:MAG: isoprenylcysteine carboxylmethyltransferase family protein [Planctomycetota bacterium]
MLLKLFILTAVLLCGVLAMLTFSIVRPSKRIWPPPAQQTWQYYFVWLLTLLSYGGFIVVGLLDWNGLGWPAIVRWPVGVSLIVGGNVLAWVGVRQLSLKTTSGSKGPLVTNGLYRYSRNPQYLGDIAIIGGWAILSASVWAIPLCLGGILAFVLTPFAEESWLEDLHGDDYREYCRRVGRFFGRRSPADNQSNDSDSC